MSRSITPAEIDAWVALARARGIEVRAEPVKIPGPVGPEVPGGNAPGKAPGGPRQTRAARTPAELAEPETAVLWSLTVGVEVISEANTSTAAGGSPLKRHARFSRQGRAFRAVLLKHWPMIGALRGYLRPGARLSVVFVRLAPRELDDDNLAGAFKAIRDTFAFEVGPDDGDRGAWAWGYDQQRCPVYGFRIEVAAAFAGGVE